MHVKNQNFAIYLILAVVVGFGLSFLFGGLSVRSDLLGGDVSKANRYYNQKEDPSFTVIEERLRNDGEFLDRTKGAMGFLQSRMTVLSELTEKTIEACAGIPEFQPLMVELQSMNAKAFNTAKALSNANDGLDKMVAGRYAPEYELYSNQAYIGFSKVESQMDLGEKFCRIATSFLEGKDAGQYEQIAQLLSVWEVYCIENSQMVADWHCPDIDSRDTLRHEQMQEGNRDKINISGPGPRPGGDLASSATEFWMNTSTGFQPASGTISTGQAWAEAAVTLILLSNAKWLLLLLRCSVIVYQSFVIA